MSRVTVLLSAYNGEKYIKEQIESLLDQTYQNMVIYIRDDRSTDNTRQVINECIRSELEKEGPREIYLLEDQDGNVGYARSFSKMCTMVPTSDYYAFCDQDDIWMSDKIEKAVRALNQENSEECLLFSHGYHQCNEAMEIVKSNTFYCINENIAPNQMELAKTIMTGNLFGLGFTMVFNHKLKELAFRDEKGISVPHDVWISWVLAGNRGRYLFEKEALAKYRRHDNAASSANLGIYRIFINRLKNVKKLCNEIKNGLQLYKNKCFPFEWEENNNIVKMLLGKNRLKKCFYKKKYRNRIAEDLSFRILMLLGLL